MRIIYNNIRQYGECPTNVMLNKKARNKNKLQTQAKRIHTMEVRPDCGHNLKEHRAARCAVSSPGCCWKVCSGWKTHQAEHLGLVRFSVSTAHFNKKKETYYKHQRLATTLQEV